MLLLPWACRSKINLAPSVPQPQPQWVGGWLYTPETDLLCARLSGCDRDNQRLGGQTEPVCGPFTQSPIPFPPGKERPCEVPRCLPCPLQPLLRTSMPSTAKLQVPGTEM